MTCISVCTVIRFDLDLYYSSCFQHLCLNLMFNYELTFVAERAFSTLKIVCQSCPVFGKKVIYVLIVNPCIYSCTVNFVPSAIALLSKPAWSNFLKSEMLMFLRSSREIVPSVSKIISYLYAPSLSKSSVMDRVLYLLWNLRCHIVIL